MGKTHVNCAGRPSPFAVVILACMWAITVPQVVLAQTAASSKPASPDDPYVLGPDSVEQPGVPTGTVSEFTLADSKTYPGYSHKWWLYVQHSTTAYSNRPYGVSGRRPLGIRSARRRMARSRRSR